MEPCGVTCASPPRAKHGAWPLSSHQSDRHRTCPSLEAALQPAPSEPAASRHRTVQPRAAVLRKGSETMPTFTPLSAGGTSQPRAQVEPCRPRGLPERGGRHWGEWQGIEGQVHGTGVGAPGSGDPHSFASRCWTWGAVHSESAADGPEGPGRSWKIPGDL